MYSDVARFGGFSATVVAIAYVVVSLNHLLSPAAGTPLELMQLLVQNPASHYVSTLGFALIALMMIPVITAMAERLVHVSPGLVRWAAAIGYIGCAGTVMNHLRMLRLVPLRAKVFVEGDEMVRSAIQYNWLGNSLDPDGWLLFGAFGLWTLVMAFAALREGSLFPRTYGYLGLATAGLFIMALLGSLSAPALGTVAAGVGGLVIGPVWFVWTGVLLRRHEVGSGHGAAASSGHSA